VKKWYELQFNTSIKDTTIEYPDADINNYFYRMLTDQEEYSGLLDPLQFFNELYEKFETILTNIKDFTGIRKYLWELESREPRDQQGQFFLLDALHYLIQNLNDGNALQFPSHTIVDIPPIIPCKSPALARIDTLIIVKLECMRQNFCTKSVFDKPGFFRSSSTRVFTLNSSDIVYEIFKDFFSIAQRDKLKNILKNGSSIDEKLIFTDNGNRLTDAFKKLYESEYITGCNKKDLSNWIKTNFLYTDKKSVKSFTDDYLKKGISRNFDPCKRPLLNIKENLIQKNMVPKRKKIN
jgi:hypothetical protein